MGELMDYNIGLAYKSGLIDYLHFLQAAKRMENLRTVESTCSLDYITPYNL